MKVASFIKKELSVIIPDAERIQILSQRSMNVGDQFHLIIDIQYVVKSIQRLQIDKCQIEDRIYEELDVTYQQIIKPSQPLLLTLNTDSGELVINNYNCKMTSVSPILIKESNIEDEEQLEQLKNDINIIKEEYEDNIEIINWYKPQKRVYHLKNIHALDIDEKIINKEALLLNGTNYYERRSVETQFRTFVDRYMKSMFGEYQVEYHAYIDLTESMPIIKDITVNGHPLVNAALVVESSSFKLQDGFIQDAHMFEKFVEFAIRVIRNQAFYHKDLHAAIEKNTREVLENITSNFSSVVPNIAVHKYEMIAEPVIDHINESDGIITLNSTMKYPLIFKQLEDDSDWLLHVQLDDFDPILIYHLNTIYDGDTIQHVVKNHRLNVELDAIKLAPKNGAPHQLRGLNELFDDDELEDQRQALVKICHKSIQEIDDVMSNIKHTEKRRL